MQILKGTVRSGNFFGSLSRGSHLYGSPFFLNCLSEDVYCGLPPPSELDRSRIASLNAFSAVDLAWGSERPWFPFPHLICRASPQNFSAVLGVIETPTARTIEPYEPWSRLLNHTKPSGPLRRIPYNPYITPLYDPGSCTLRLESNLPQRQ